MASEILNLFELCRCCHTSGSFTHLDMTQNLNGVIKSYAATLLETFGIFLSQPAIEASHTICDVCIEKLRNALEFKKQVEECERKFINYCNNYEVTIEPEVQIKVEELDCVDTEENWNGEDRIENVKIFLPITEIKHDNSLKKEQNKIQPGLQSSSQAELHSEAPEKISRLSTDDMPSTSTGPATGVELDSNTEKILRQKRLNAERCRRYRLKCKRLKSSASSNQGV